MQITMFGLEFFIKAMEVFENKALHVRPLQCSRLRHQLSKCQLCSTCCPTMAISWGESLDIAADKCSGCGICTTVCPTGALEANNPTNEVLLKRIASVLKHADEIVFACSSHQPKIAAGSVQTGNIVTVPCLGRIDESILVGGVALGATSMCLVDDFCPDCNRKAGWDIAQQTIVTASNILGMLGISAKIAFSPKPIEWGIPKAKTTTAQPPDSVDEEYSRRGFLEALTQETKKATILATSSMIKDDVTDGKVEIRKTGLPFYLPQKRRLLLDAMRKLGEATCLPVSRDKLPFYHLKIDASCTGCGMCAYFCPTGALQKNEKDGKVVITFQLATCTRCNLCREICYKGAVSVSTKIKPEKLLSHQSDTLFVTTATLPPEQPLKR